MTTSDKAIIGAILAALSSLAASLQATDPVDTRAWLVLMLSAVVTGLGVWLVPNRPRGQRRRPADVGPEGGQTNQLLQLVLIIAGILVIVWLLLELLGRT